MVRRLLDLKIGSSGNYCETGPFAQPGGIRFNVKMLPLAGFNVEVVHLNNFYLHLEEIPKSQEICLEVTITKWNKNGNVPLGYWKVERISKTFSSAHLLNHSSNWGGYVLNEKVKLPPIHLNQLQLTPVQLLVIIDIVGYRPESQQRPFVTFLGLEKPPVVKGRHIPSADHRIVLKSPLFSDFSGPIALGTQMPTVKKQKIVLSSTCIDAAQSVTRMNVVKSSVPPLVTLSDYEEESQHHNESVDDVPLSQRAKVKGKQTMKDAERKTNSSSLNVAASIPPKRGRPHKLVAIQPRLIKSQITRKLGRPRKLNAIPLKLPKSEVDSNCQVVQPVNKTVFTKANGSVYRIPRKSAQSITAYLNATQPDVIKSKVILTPVIVLKRLTNADLAKANCTSKLISLTDSSGVTKVKQVDYVPPKTPNVSTENRAALKSRMSTDIFAIIPLGTQQPNAKRQKTGMTPTDAVRIGGTKSSIGQTGGTENRNEPIGDGPIAQKGTIKDEITIEDDEVVKQTKKGIVKAEITIGDDEVVDGPQPNYPVHPGWSVPYFPDFNITTADEYSFPVNKHILCESCPYFETLLHMDMTEAATGQVKSPRNSALMLQLLKFLYKPSDFTRNQDVPVEDLFEAANFYMLDGLKRICEVEMSKQLSFDTLPFTVGLANQLNGVFLLEKCGEFVVRRGVDHLFKYFQPDAAKVEKLLGMLAPHMPAANPKKKPIRRSDRIHK